MYSNIKRNDLPRWTFYEQDAWQILLSTICIPEQDVTWKAKPANVQNPDDKITNLNRYLRIKEYHIKWQLRI